MQRKFILAAAGSCLAFAAQAGTMDATGTGHGESNSTVMPVSDGLVAIQAASTYTGFDTASADNPLTSLTGSCFGSLLIKAGAVSGGGLCHYTDAGGETVIMGWEADGVSESGRTQGDWRIEGGTGKWTAATGGGRFDAGVDSAGVYTNNITGEITTD